MTDEILIEQPGKKPALHQSILAGLSKCAKQVEYRYVYGLKVPPGIAMLVGTATHAGADMALVAKAKGERVEAGAIVEKARETLIATASGEGVVLDEDEEELGEKAAVAKAADQAGALVKLYHGSVLPRRNPKSPQHVERRLRAVLEGFPFDLEGTIDLHEADGSLRDLKTASRSPAEDAAIGNVQLDAYSLLTTLADAILPARVGLDVLVKKTKGDEVAIREARPPSNFEAITARIEHAARVFEKGAFYPVDPHGPSGWVCTKKFCGYYDSVCPFGARSRVSVAMGGA